MMDSALETAEKIREAVRTVALSDGSKLKVYDDPAAAVNPPCAIVGLPELQLDGSSFLPTGARYPVAVMVPNNKASANKLLDLVPLVAQAVQELVPDAVIPGDIFPAIIEIGGTQLPGYMILVEV
jgi:hypothetical protein